MVVGLGMKAEQDFPEKAFLLGRMIWEVMVDGLQPVFSMAEVQVVVLVCLLLWIQCSEDSSLQEELRVVEAAALLIFLARLEQSRWPFAVLAFEQHSP
jgi:hypothetical protein